MQLMVDGLYYLTNFTLCTIKLMSIITLVCIPDFAVTVTKPPSMWITGVRHTPGWLTKPIVYYHDSVSYRPSVCIMDHTINRPMWPNPNGKVSWLMQLNCKSLSDVYN